MGIEKATKQVSKAAKQVRRTTAIDTARVEEPAAEWVAVEKLAPWTHNPRKNDENVKRVIQSIKRFGFAAPIVARKADGEIIAGHTRLKAAQALGLSHVPVRYLDLDPADAHLLALADNRLNELSPWDVPNISSGAGQHFQFKRRQERSGSAKAAAPPASRVIPWQ